MNPNWEYSKHSKLMKAAGGPKAYDIKIFKAGQKNGISKGIKIGEKRGDMKGSIRTATILGISFLAYKFISANRDEIKTRCVKAKESIKEKVDSLKAPQKETLDISNSSNSPTSEIEHEKNN